MGVSKMPLGTAQIANPAMNAYASSITTGAGIVNGTVAISNTTGGTWLGQPLQAEGQHIFNCQKVENGWFLNYRNKQYIAADLDSLMEQMKTAMVSERISK